MIIILLKEDGKMIKLKDMKYKNIMMKYMKENLKIILKKDMEQNL